MSFLILGSSSPYRQEMLKRLGVPFDVCVPNVDETPLVNESGLMLTQRLAATKARAIAKQFQDAWIIGADQVAVCQGEVIGKPGNHSNALIQLQKMQGNEVTFYSALCVLSTKTNLLFERVVPTVVQFRELPLATLEAYLLAEQPYDCAGSAKAEGMGIMLTASIKSDDPTALIGLPLIALTDLLLASGFPLFESAWLSKAFAQDGGKP